MNDVTFCIPYRKDSLERERNLNMIINYIKKLGGKYLVEEYNQQIFHRTKILNNLYKKAETNIIVIMDADVMIPPDNMQKAYKYIQDGYTLAYPYDGRFFNVPNNAVNLSFDDWDKMELQRLSPGNNSKGGCIFAHKELYRTCGWENEYIVDWGCDDDERFARVSKLDGKIGVVPGKLFHLNHPRHHYCNYGQPYYKNNYYEYLKVLSMNKDQLKKYINIWDWCK